jgi:hypothetical protein
VARLYPGASDFEKGCIRHLNLGLSTMSIMSIQRLAKLLCCTFLLASLSLITLVSGNSSRVVHAEMKHLLRGMVADHTGAAIPNFKVGLWVRSREGTVPMREMGSPVLTAQTDRDGQFSVELQPGSYEVCVVRLLKSCRELLVEETSKSLEYLNFRINPVDDPASSGLLDKRIREISGPVATDCGRVRREDSPKRATKCALRAYKSHKAFYVRYDDKGIGDSEGARAIGADSAGEVYSLEFDSLGMDTTYLPPGTTMPDGFHTKVIACSLPIRLRVTRGSGELICFADGRWLGDK